MGIYDELYAQCLAELSKHVCEITGGAVQPVSTTVDYLSNNAFDAKQVRFTPNIDRATRTMVFSNILAEGSDGNLMRVTAVFHRS